MHCVILPFDWIKADYQDKRPRTGIIRITTVIFSKLNLHESKFTSRNNAKEVGWPTEVEPFKGGADSAAILEKRCPIPGALLALFPVHPSSAFRTLPASARAARFLPFVLSLHRKGWMGLNAQQHKKNLGKPAEKTLYFAFCGWYLPAASIKQRNSIWGGVMIARSHRSVFKFKFILK